MSAAEVDAGRGLRALELKRALSRNIVAGALGTFFGVCIWPQFLTTFVLLLGGNAFHVGLITTLPLLAFPAQIVSALVVERLDRRKEFWFWTATIHRCLWFVIAGLAFWAGRGLEPWQITAFFVLLFLTHATGAMSVPPWFSWMADLVPREEATRFWSRRSMWHQMVALTGVVLGRLADTFPPGALWPFGILFFVAAAAGQLDLVVHRAIPEPAPQRGDQPASWTGLFEPVREPNFRRLVARMSLLTFAVNFSNAFLVLFLLERVGLNQTQVSVATAVMFAARMFIARFWGFLGDRFGNQPVSLVCECVLVLFPMAFLFVPAGHAFAYVLVVHAVAGLFNVGMESSVNGLMLGLSPNRQKSLFIAMFFSLTGVVGALGPMAGSLMLDRVGTAQWHGVGRDWGSFDALFLVATLLRLVTLPVSFSVREPSGKPAGQLVRRLLESNPLRVVHYSYVLNDTSDMEARVQSAQELGDARSAIATADLVRALRDASLDVRRESARALGRIGDRDAVEGLISALGEPELLVEDEVARALGRIGDGRAVPALVRALDDPHARREAARALGEIGDPGARAALLGWLKRPEADEGTRALCAEALARIGDPADIPVVVRELCATRSTVARRQMTLAAAQFAVPAEEAYRVLSRELRVPGDRVLDSVRDVVREEPDAPACALVKHAGWNYEACEWGPAARAFIGATLTRAGGVEIDGVTWRETGEVPGNEGRPAALARELGRCLGAGAAPQEAAVLAYLAWRGAREADA